MAYAIGPGCCADASCVAVCPVNCIHPTPDEPEFGSTSTLYVDPRTCIDCGACADACPVDAIHPSDLFRGPDAVHVRRNKDFYAGRDETPIGTGLLVFTPVQPVGERRLSVAVVGSGPAAWYTADLLLRTHGARVTLFERLRDTGGLLRYGVAPDHPDTRRLGRRFASLQHNPDLRVRTGVEVGVDVSPADLARRFDAVIYAVGAFHGRRLDLPGASLPGSVTAADVVGWYNGHPEAGRAPVGPATRRVVVLGNGNVALDVARVLVRDPAGLTTTDISPAALAVLRTSGVREVVVAARRGPQDAAYTAGELHDLVHLPDVEVVVADTPGTRETIAAAPTGSAADWLRELPLVAPDGPPADGRRVVLQFGTTPVAVTGTSRVDGVEFAEGLHRPADLVVHAVGHHGRPVAGLAFDPVTGTMPHDAGRLLDGVGGAPVPGHYVVGWIKRGPTGGIGANRQDAAETVASLIADTAATPRGPARPAGPARRGRPASATAGSAPRPR